MIRSRVTFEVDEPEVDRLLRSRGGAVAQAVNDVAERTARAARSRAPVDSGRLRNSIRVRSHATASQFKAWVYTNVEYSVYVHEGTGIYGPRGRPIRPRRGRFLAWEDPNGGGMIFAREVRGQRPQPYLLDALRFASPWPVDDRTLYT